MKTYNKGRQNEFRACNQACASGFKTDRKHGLIYGPLKYTDGSFAMNAEEFSRETDTCAYCGADNIRHTKSTPNDKGSELINFLAHPTIEEKTPEDLCS